MVDLRKSRVNSRMYKMLVRTKTRYESTSVRSTGKERGAFNG
jgi:hypothetical protein